jgi:HlyD family secretion protein
VREGQVLLELWSDDASAQARAAAEREQSVVLRANEACLQAEVAERDAKRAETLNRDGLLPFETFDRASANAKALRASCEAATIDVRQSRASLEAARATLTRTVLRAPFPGVVAKINGELGEFTTPSPPGIPTLPAVDLIDDSCLYVSAPIDEVDVARVGVGQSAWVTLEAIPGRRMAGRVRRIAPYVLDLEKQARTVDVEVELTDPAALKALLVGYSADVEIILDAKESAVRVPTQALMEGNRVFVYDPDGGRLVETRLDTGLSNWEFTEVTRGLEPGAKVVLSVEREGVKDGAKVTPEPARPK